jgi:hypothetical protein
MQQKDWEFTSRILAKYGLPTASAELCSSEQEIIGAGKKISYPVALKAISADIVHKTDVGGVELNLKNDSELLLAYRKMSAKLGNRPGQKFLVQKMEAGLEVIAGMKRDKQFGPVIMVGLGGIFVEVMKDVAFRVAPIKEKEAEAMLEELKAYKILEGARGKKYDISALARILVKISDLSMKEPEVLELDLNPIMLKEKGAAIVDARIMGS